MSVSFVLALICGGMPNWEAVRLNNDGGPGHDQHQSASVQTDEGLIATWIDERDGDLSVRARLLPGDGSYADQSTRISGNAAAADPMASSAPDGRNLAAWSASGISGWQGRWMLADGTPDGPMVTFAIEGEEVSGNIQHQVLTVGSDGNVLISWQAQSTLLFTALFSPNGTLLHGPTMFGAENFEFGPLDAAAQADGTYVVAWVGRDEMYHSRPHVRHLDATGTPTGEINSLDPDTIQVMDIQVEAGDGAESLVVWREWNGSNRVLYASLVTAAAVPVGATYQVNTTPMGSASQAPAIAHVQGHGWVVAWLDGTSSTAPRNVRTRTLSANAVPQGAGDRECLPDSPTEGFTGVRLVGGGVEPTLLWTNSDAVDQDVRQRNIDPDGTADGPIVATSDDTESATQSNPIVAARPGGGFVSAWLDGSNGENELYIRSFDSDGQATSDVIRVQDTAIGFARAYHADIASSAAGFAVSWIDDRTSFGKAYVQRYDPDLQPVGGNITISTWSSPPNGYSNAALQSGVAMKDDGTVGYVFSWSRVGDQYNRDSYFRVVRTDGTLTNMTRINPSYIIGESYDVPSVIVLSDGGFGATYVESFPDWSDAIQYRRYSANGAAQGLPIAVFVSQGWLSWPKLATNGKGDALLAWDEGWGLYDGMVMLAMDDAGPLGTPIEVPPAVASFAIGVRPAVADDGTRLITWDEAVPTKDGSTQDRIGYATMAPDAPSVSSSVLLTAISEGSIQEDPYPAFDGNQLVIAVSANIIEGQGMDAFAIIESNPCPADVDGSGDVDVEDVLLLISAWGSSDSDADLDGSGTVGVDDLLMLLGSFGCQA